MEYITTKEASEKWGISTIRITVLANEGRIPGAKRLGKSWLIPASATKPPKLKANHSKMAKKEAEIFSFPLFHFRPDLSYINTKQLSAQQQNLFLAEGAVLECRFLEAYASLESIISAPEDVLTEIGALWNAAVCCISLNKPEEFYKIFLRLQFLLSEDVPHKDDLVIILDILKTYIETMDSIAKKNASSPDIHEQCLPLACVHTSYIELAKEAILPNSVDTPLLELNLRFLKSTGAIVVIEMMHFHLLGIYYLRQDIQAAEAHAHQALQIAIENKYYFPLVTYYRYFASILSPLLMQYPEDIQKLCNKLISEYEKNFNAFASSIYAQSVISKLSDSDYPYIYAVLLDLTNAQIAERFDKSPRTVTRRIEMLCQKIGVNNKKELKEFLHKNI